MWSNTIVTKILKIKLPIIQAPMGGGYTTPELIAAVSNAGGLGSLGAGYMRPEDISVAIKKIKSLTDKPYSVNLFIPEPYQSNNETLNLMTGILNILFSQVCSDIQPITSPYAQSFDEQAQVLVDEKVPIVSFTFGIPTTKWIEKFKRNKTILIGTATTLHEAKLLEKKGMDMIVAQGIEAGGHRGTFLENLDDSLIGNFALIPQLSDHLKIPVIASGGIMDARSIIAALALGASAVQMGTAFLACPEAGTHPKFKKMLLNMKEDKTILTRAFSGKWARGIKNKFIHDMDEFKKHILDFPVQNALTRQIRDAAAKKGLTDFLSLWAGQAAYLSTGLTAKRLIQHLDRDVKQLLKKLNH